MDVLHVDITWYIYNGCVACRHHMVNDTGVVCSSVTGRRFKVDNNFNCSDCGIYVIDTTCTAQYTFE